ncbi:hypothetical protein HNO86_20465 [Pseudomonas sp. C1C7]|uniref:DUF6137 domain-containing protein n=1 Tax=Pseudomonas sp. C1C7 TaxID=2735272 RepID=UPI001586B85E|nr:DUF6137 domain-containing protein [Pseudomonas sp. C1C7]NUT77424.1 hypothetical protein [Pseudomonas sp. C1C7]
MTLHFIRQLVIHTICNVVGETPEDVTALNKVELNTRDWEQVFSRLEATLDIQTDKLASTERTISIGTLARELHTKITDDIVI